MKILFILPNYNLYGGTPKKTIDLINQLNDYSLLYVYSNQYSELKPKFEESNAKVFEGNFGRNFIKHIKKINKIIKEEKVDIIQTQFFFGELIGSLAKLNNPQVKLIITFVGANQNNPIRNLLSNYFYSKADYLIFISHYIRNFYLKQSSTINNKRSKVIYNGTDKRLYGKDSRYSLKKHTVVAISGLIKLKNIQILLESFNIIVNQKQIKNIYLYVIGEGPYRNNLEFLINKYNLNGNVFLHGYRKNIGYYLHNCDVFVHPSYNEGFGIAVAEAMHARKPIIVARAGALPELIINNKSGLVVDPFDSNEWVNAILYLINNPCYSDYLAKNAEVRAKKLFTVKEFCCSYSNVYNELLNKK